MKIQCRFCKNRTFNKSKICRDCIGEFFGIERYGIGLLISLIKEININYNKNGKISM